MAILKSTKIYGDLDVMEVTKTRQLTTEEIIIHGTTPSTIKKEGNVLKIISPEKEGEIATIEEIASVKSDIESIINTKITNHNHGDITNLGQINSEVVTSAAGDYIIISDVSASNQNTLKRGIRLDSSGKIEISSISGVSPLVHTHEFDEITGRATLDQIPTALPPSIITQDATNRFVKDADITVWNAKQNALNGTGFIKIVGSKISYDNKTYAELDHVHGNITNDGAIVSAATAPQTGDYLIISDANSEVNHALKRGIALNSSGKIPFSSLEKVPLTSFVEKDPTVPSWVKSISEGDITNWNNKIGNNHPVNGIAHGIGYLKNNGTAWYYDNTEYSANNHTHGNITNLGSITKAAVAPATGDFLIIADASNSNRLDKSIGLNTSGKIPFSALEGNPLTANQEITISGDVSGKGRTAITLTLGNVTTTKNTSTVSPEFGETFTAIDEVTTDTKGRVTGMTTKTVNLPIPSPQDELDLAQKGSGNVIGSLSVKGHTITVNKINALTSFTEKDPLFTAWKNDTVGANLVLAGPTTGSDTAIYRKLIQSDIPNLTKSKITDFSHTHGTIANDGAITATKTVSPAFDGLLIYDGADSNKIKRGIPFTVGTAASKTFLNGEGVFATPENTKYTLSDLVPATATLNKSKEYVLKTKYSGTKWDFTWQEVEIPVE